MIRHEDHTEHRLTVTLSLSLPGQGPIASEPMMAEIYLDDMGAEIALNGLGNSHPLYSERLAARVRELLTAARPQIIAHCRAEAAKEDAA